MNNLLYSKLFLLGTILLVSSVAFSVDRLPSPMIIGHRGFGTAHGENTENSIASLIKAFKAGADAVEFDVQLSADNEVVLAHDPRLSRISNGKGCVSQFSMNALRKLRLRDGNKRVLENATLPTLTEALEAIRKFDTGKLDFFADIHIKVYDGKHGDAVGLHNIGCPVTDYSTLTTRVLNIVNDAKLLHRVFFTSFDSRVLDTIRKLAPTANVGHLALFADEKLTKNAKEKKYDAIVIYYLFNNKIIEKAHALGLKTFVWSPKKKNEIKYFIIQRKVDGVIVDNIPNALEAAYEVGR